MLSKQYKVIVRGNYEVFKVKRILKQLLSIVMLCCAILDHVDVLSGKHEDFTISGGKAVPDKSLYTCL